MARTHLALGNSRKANQTTLVLGSRLASSICSKFSYTTAAERLDEPNLGGPVRGHGGP
jgi:hypothetical protein